MEVVLTFSEDVSTLLWVFVLGVLFVGPQVGVSGVNLRVSVSRGQSKTRYRKTFTLLGSVDSLRRFHFLHRFNVPCL